MQVVGFERALELLDYGALVDELRTQHAAPAAHAGDLYLAEDRSGFLLRAAWQPDEVLGVKLATVFPGNDVAGLPTVHGVYVLFDATNGTPRAVIDGIALTWYKTAADSALGADYLARTDVETMLMVGAGSMAPHLISAHLAVRPSIGRLLVWNRTVARAQLLVDTLDADVAARVTDNLEAAVRAADLISCATMTTDPLIRGAWLSPGTHLDLVGAFTPTMREADDEAMRRADVYVDSRESTLEPIGELSIPLATGVIDTQDIRADLYELCRGEVAGRTDDDAITLFKNGGGGHLDLMTAQFVMAQLSSAPPSAAP